MAKKIGSKKAVHVYLHPKTRNPFVYKGSSINPPSRENDPRNALEAFWLEEDLYNKSVAKYEARKHEQGSFPQFVLVEETRRTIREDKLWDQPVDRIGGLGGAPRPELILEAFKNLDHDDDNHWNKDGSPKIKELERALGFLDHQVRTDDPCWRYYSRCRGHRRRQQNKVKTHGQPRFKYAMRLWV